MSGFIDDHEVMSLNGCQEDAITQVMGESCREVFCRPDGSSMRCLASMADSCSAHRRGVGETVKAARWAANKLDIQAC
jgi:hypothetical protein